MNRVAVLGVTFAAYAGLAHGQGRPVDWPSYGGDARRTGWERSDTRITPDNIKDFQLVLKRKLEGPGSGARSLSAPVIIGNLISYRGFKELGFVLGNSGRLWSIDVDIDRIFWQKQLEVASGKKSGRSPVCSDGLTALPTLTPPMTFGARRSSARRPGSSSPGIPPTPAGRSTALPARVGGGGFGAPRPLYVLTDDGKLHQFNTSDGSDQFPALNFLPAGAKAASLTMHDNVIYAATVGNCGGAPNAVWAIDLAVEEPAVTSFPLPGGEAGGIGGLALGNDGTVYVQTGPGASDPASGKWANTLLALSPRDLKLKHSFSAPEGAAASKGAPDMNVVTPVVFEHDGRDLIVTAGRDGRLYLLDSEALGGEDHKTSLYQTPRIAAADSPTEGIWGGISSWEDADGVRWIAVPVWGSVSPELKVPMTNGAASNGAIVAFKLEDQNGKPVLTPAWVSRNLLSPQPPVITSGGVFALSSGEYTRKGTELRPKGSSRATLYALDAATGKEIYSSGNQVSASANLTGLSLANGRVFFTTTDGTLYGFGIYLER